MPVNTRTEVTLVGVIKDGSKPITNRQSIQDLTINQGEDTTVLVEVVNQDGTSPTFDVGSYILLAGKASLQAESFIFHKTVAITVLAPASEGYSASFPFDFSASETAGYSATAQAGVYDAWLVVPNGDDGGTPPVAVYVRTRLIPKGSLVVAAEVG